MTVFVTSDTHFGHKRIIELCNRPFPLEDKTFEMDEVLIKNWNAKVRPNDTIYHLGDYTYHYDSDYLREQFDRLNGHKFLIEGNHDPAYVKNLPWDGVFKYQEIKYNKKVFVLFHYPILEWNGFHRNKDELVYIHLHGHIHSTPLDSKYPKIRGRMDVGVDANGFTPLSLDEVIRSVEY